ncbi:MAG: hypothetical protein AB7H77_03380 [Bdellovibrionales bacterium]
MSIRQKVAEQLAICAIHLTKPAAAPLIQEWRTAAIQDIFDRHGLIPLLPNVGLEEIIVSKHGGGGGFLTIHGDATSTIYRNGIMVYRGDDTCRTLVSTNLTRKWQGLREGSEQLQFIEDGRVIMTIRHAFNSSSRTTNYSVQTNLGVELGIKARPAGFRHDFDFADELSMEQRRKDARYAEIARFFNDFRADIRGLHTAARTGKLVILSAVFIKLGQPVVKMRVFAPVPGPTG